MISFGAISINFGDLLFQIVVFLILFLLIKKYATGPVISIMEKRQKYVEDQISSAEKARTEAEAFLVEQRAALATSKEEAQAIIERAKKQSEVEAKATIEEAVNRATRMIEEAKAEILSERDKAIATVRDQVAGLSVLLASKIIEKELDEKQQMETIEQFMRQVGDHL